ncbi:DNA topoisomerase I [Candidatus Woesearchaeota archaeon]|nr:DNA topoisomerase I [Candidatus Woesearchaeota archaeon]
MTELIITEKPSTALKIATALSDKKLERKIYGKKIPYYEIQHKGNEIIVVSAVGHLYNLREKDKKGWKYPVFSVEWKPSYEVNKISAHTKLYLEAIKKLCKNVEEITVATDFDIEGEVIGYNIVRFACNKKDARRMKFSTTTQEDLIESYEHVKNHLEWGQAKAGLTRHELDWWWGINLSRALTLSIKNATGKFKLLSSGRVQGPTLKLLADREKEIKAFVPEDYWELHLHSGVIDALHEENTFAEKNEALERQKKADVKSAVVDDLKLETYDQMPPNPFDLTSLQMQAYKHLGIQPKDTLSIAQELYVNSYISYPRTSSTQLPESIGYQKILKKLSSVEDYEELCKKLLAVKGLKPNNGKKTDPAHPAIYPTGEYPKELKAKEKLVYDLIVRRFLATFGPNAKRETMTLMLDANGEKFRTLGSRTVDKGWHVYYGKYAKFDEAEFPKLKKGEKLPVDNIELLDKQTQPPRRFTPASIIKELDKKMLGTKATRPAILDNLFQRNYLSGTSIEVTDLGLKTVETLEKYCPEIIDDEMTKNLEVKMEEIRSEKKESEEILDEAKKELTGILEKFKKNEPTIGKALSEANAETQEQESHVGKCNKCEGDLRILYSRKFKGRFVACKSYPECRNTFSLPQGLPKVTEKKCEACGFPIVLIIRAGKRPFDYCINKQCQKKLEWIEQQKAKEESKMKASEASS